MMLIDIIGILSTILGILSALVVLLFRRFGPASWILGCYLLLGAAVSGIGIIPAVPGRLSSEFIFRLSISILLVIAPLGPLFTWAIDRNTYRQSLAKKWKLIFAITLPVPILITLLFLLQPAIDELPVSQDLVALGPGGYLCSLYLLVLATLALSSLEQILRTIEERVKWEIKFLFLGVATNYVAILYLSSKALLYSFRYALLSKDALNAFIFVFPVSCLLILASWRRVSGNARVAVSQSLIYSSITLLSVGAYLIGSSLITWWISRQGELGQLHAVVFLLSIIALAILLLWTSFRHRVRDWIRRNVFAGKYDYRHFWMEASERIRSVDGVDNSAMALANLVQRALGAIHISIWLRNRDSEGLRCVAALGDAIDFQGQEMKGILEKIADIADSVTMEEVEKMPGNMAIRHFGRQTNAELLVPLCSSGRLIGVLTVGSDRSGRSYDGEARDFLRVLANHAASEFHKYNLLADLMAAKEAEAFKSFSTFLLHDLKNFASTLSLIAKNASRHHDNPDFQRDAFQSIFDTAEKMKRLCNNLRAFSSNLAANKKPDDLNRIVRNVLDKLEVGLSRQFRTHLEKTPAVLIDADDVAKVLQNLFLNASEAISPDGAITIKTSYRDGNVELSVVDNGAGMSSEFLEKELFLPFHTTKSDGLGIGLFQCKKIIEAHDGRIHVKSEAGKGTAVTVAFPVVAEANQAVRS
jgi:putative PEP-CTERM system histidine kinase